MWALIFGRLATCKCAIERSIIYGASAAPWLHETSSASCGPVASYMNSSLSPQQQVLARRRQQLYGPGRCAGLQAIQS